MIYQYKRSHKKIYKEMWHEVLVITVGSEKLDENILIDNVAYIRLKYSKRFPENIFSKLL